MAADVDILTPQQRLAYSRRALMHQLQGGDQDDMEPHLTQPPRHDGMARRFSWASIGGNVMARWWRRHPANAVGQLARPVLDRYARKEPVKLMTAAAATGALVVLIKPWRLLSITAVIAAVLKTSDVADIVTTLMNKNSSPRKDSP